MPNSFTTTLSAAPTAPPGSTLAGLRAIVQQNLGNRTDKSMLIDSALNAALRQAVQRHRFKRLAVQSDLTLTTGVQAVVMPANAIQVVELRIIDGTMSHRIDLADKVMVTERFPNPWAFSNQRPSIAYEESGVLYFSPVPDKTYTLRGTYLFNPATLVSDTDSAGVDGLDAAMITYATSYVMRSIEKFSEADSWERQFEKELSAAIIADRRRPATVVLMQPHPRRGAAQSSDSFGSAFSGHFNSRRW